MKSFHSMALKSIIPVLVSSIIFFVLILELADMLGNLWRYINNNVEIVDIFRVGLYYMPKCISYALPIALLFSISYSLGMFYSSNELISVFNSGIPLVKFVAPFLMLGIILSLGGFIFEEKVVISTFKQKEDLAAELLNQRKSLSNDNVVRLSDDRQTIYFADYYNDRSKTLSGLVIVIRDENLDITSRIDCDYAQWKKDKWELHRTVQYKRVGREFEAHYVDTFALKKNIILPDEFQKPVVEIDQMTTLQAREFIDNLKKAGLPVYREALTEYYERFAFAFTPFIVAILSCSIGGKFKKNILLMSLLVSLCIAVVYYVIQMVAVLFAKQGYINPITGAWFSVGLFSLIGFWLFRIART